MPEIPRNEDEGESIVSDNIDELVSLDGSEYGDDEAAYVRHPTFVKKKYPEFNTKVDMKDPKFVVGMTFSSANVFREVVRATEGQLSLRRMTKTKSKLGASLPSASGWYMHLG